MEENNNFLNLTEEDQLNNDEDKNDASPEAQNQTNNQNQDENNTNQDQTANLTETISAAAQELLGSTNDQVPTELPQKGISEFAESLTNAADSAIKTEPENTENITDFTDSLKNAVDTITESIDKHEEQERNNEQTASNENEQENKNEDLQINTEVQNTLDEVSNLIANEANETENKAEEQENKIEDLNINVEIQNTVDTLAEGIEKEVKNDEENENETKENSGSLSTAIDSMTNALIRSENQNEQPIIVEEEEEVEEENQQNVEIQTDETAKEYVYDSEIVSLHEDPQTLHERFLFNHVVYVDIFPSENDPIRCLFSATTDTRVFENYCKYLKLSEVTTVHFSTRNNENGSDNFFTFCTGKELTTLINPTDDQIVAALRSFKQSYVIPCSPEDSEKLRAYEKVERYASKSMIEYVNEQINQQKDALKTDLYEYENPVTFSTFLNVSIESLLGYRSSISSDECERIHRLDHEYTHVHQCCSAFDDDFDFSSLLGINNVREIELSPNKFVYCTFSATEDKVLDTFLSLTNIGKAVSYHFSTSPNGHVNYFTLCTGRTLISIINPSQNQMNIVFDKVKNSYLIPCGLNDKTQLFFYDYMNKIHKIASDRDAKLIAEEIKKVQESIFMRKFKYDIASSYQKFLNISYPAFIGYLVRSQYLEPIVQPTEFKSFNVYDFIPLRKLDYGKIVALNWPEGKVYIMKQYRDLFKFNQAIYLYKNNKMSCIIPFYGEAINNENFLVFGLGSRGTLKEVSLNEHLEISTARKISIQLVFLLAYLHMTDTKPCSITADNISIDWNYNAYLSDFDGSEKVIRCTPEELDINNLANVLYTLVTGTSLSSSFPKGIPSTYEPVSRIFELCRKPETTACDLVSSILCDKIFSKDENLIDSLLAELPHHFDTIEAFEDCTFNYFKINCKELTNSDLNFIKTLKFGKNATIQFIASDNDQNRIFIFETSKICGTFKNVTPQIVNLIASKMRNCMVSAVSDRDLDTFFEYYNFDLIQNFSREPLLLVFRKSAVEAKKEMNEFDDKFIVEETLALSYAIANTAKYLDVIEPVITTPQFPQVSLLNEDFNLHTIMPKNQLRLIEIYKDSNLTCLYSTEEDYTYNEFMKNFTKNDKFVVVHFSKDDKNEFVSFCSNKKLLLLPTQNENQINNQVNKVINKIKDVKIYGVGPEDRSRLFGFTNFDLIQSFATKKEMEELLNKVRKTEENLFIQNFTFDKPPMSYSSFFNHTKSGITAYYLLTNPDFEQTSQSLSKIVEQSIDFASSVEKIEENSIQQTPTQTFADFDTEEDLKKAFNLYTLAAERNDPSAFFNLGLMYSTGQGVEKDKTKAAEYYTKAAELGNPKAQFNLGLMYYQGEGVEENKQEAARLYQLASDQGVAKAQSNLGLMYSKGDGVEQNYEKAVELYEKAVEQNDADAQLNLGMMCEIGQGTPVDKERAIDLYTKSAENGNSKAQFNLGVIYHNGEPGILKKDNKKAIKYYSMASSKGLAKAQFNLGVLYSKGDEDIPVDKKMAAQLFQLAADQNDSDAQLNLGAMYAKGDGVPEVDKSKTLELYKKSAKQGNPKAQFNLAVMHSKGDGTQKNFKKAAKYYQKASDQDISQASFNLGVIYFRGAEGVEEDKTKAAELFEKATNLNPKNSKALYNLGIMNMKGDGVEQNNEKALDYFEKAADLNNKDSLLNLGLIYVEGGCGVEPNTKKAFSYYKRAAELGNDKALLNLGLMYQSGEGCEKDIEKARECYEKAAEKGNAQAQINLGLLLIGRDDELKDAEKKQLEESAEKGNTESMYDLGCKYQEDDDIENAIKWFTKAAAKDNSKAQLELGKIYLYGKQTDVDLNKSEQFLQSAAKNNELDASVHLEKLNEERERSIALASEIKEEEIQNHEANQNEEVKEENNEEAKEENNEEVKEENNEEVKEENNEEAKEENNEEAKEENNEEVKEENNEEVKEENTNEEQIEGNVVERTIPEQSTDDEEEEQKPTEEKITKKETQTEEESTENKLVLADEEEEEEEAVIQTLTLDVASEDKQPENKKEEVKLTDIATLNVNDEEEEDEEEVIFTNNEPIDNLYKSLEERIKKLNDESNEPYSNTLDKVHDLFVYKQLSQYLSNYNKATNSLKTIEEETENVLNKISENDKQSTSNLPSLTKSNKVRFSNETNSDSFSDDDELNRLKSEVQKLETQINQIDQQISNSKKAKSTNTNNSVRSAPVLTSIIKEPDTPRHSKNVKIQSPRSARHKVKNLEKKAEEGDASAQYSLGALYSLGKGVELDKQKGFEYYLKSADQGYINSQFAVASCYAYGKGTEIDKQKAFDYYMMAAEQGHDKSQFAVGHFYDCGYGVEQNHQKAVEWYRKAAEKGHQAAIDQLKSESDEGATLLVDDDSNQ